MSGRSSRRIRHPTGGGGGCGGGGDGGDDDDAPTRAFDVNGPSSSPHQRTTPSGASTTSHPFVEVDSNIVQLILAHCLHKPQVPEYWEDTSRQEQMLQMYDARDVQHRFVWGAAGEGDGTTTVIHNNSKASKKKKKKETSTVRDEVGTVRFAS